MVTAYAAMTNTDLTEGRGRTIAKSYHHDESEALVACRGIGVWGRDGEVAAVLAIKLLNGLLLVGFEVVSVEPVDREALRKEALQKLSKAEREVLGLS